MYLYSTLDDATETAPRSDTSLLRVNSKHSSLKQTEGTTSGSGATGTSISDALMEQDIDMFMDLDAAEGDELSSEESTEDDEDVEDEDEDDMAYFRYRGHVPIVYPRTRYAGACNVQTVKDGKLLARIPACTKC